MGVTIGKKGVDRLNADFGVTVEGFRDAGRLAQVELAQRRDEARYLQPQAFVERGHLEGDDIAALDSCNICVALLTGPDQDSGTSAELGYMYAHGKRCYGITDDFRFLNNMLWGICGEGLRIAPDIAGLLTLVGSA